MRIHVAIPHASTVSVDDDLAALLGAALVMDRPALQADAREQLSLARRFVRDVVKGHGPAADGLSRAVQRAIFRRIAHPQVVAILDARDSEEAKAKAAAAYLKECAEKGWQTPDEIAEKRRVAALEAEGRKRRKAERLKSL